MSATASTIGLLDAWLWFKFDESAGTTTFAEAGAAVNNGGTLLYGSPLTPNAGTMTNAFDNAGAFTSPGDIWYASRTSGARRTAQKNFFDCSTLCANGEQLIVMGRASINANPSADEIFWSSGSNHATLGGIGLIMNNSGKVQLRHRPGGGASAESFTQQNALPAAHAAIKTFAFVVDGINKYSAANDGVNFQPVVHVFGDNGLESSNPMTAPIGTGDDGTNHGCVLFGLSGVSTPTNRLGNAGSGIRVYDIFVQRTNNDLSTSLMRIFRDMLHGGPGTISSEQSA